MKKLMLTILTLAAAVAWGGCSKMDDYREFAAGKVKKYAGRVDSLRLYPGDGRLVMSWLHIADPNVNRVTISWNAADSVVVPVKRTDNPDSLAYEFKPLPEGVYSFTVVTTNSFGERSVPVFISGKSYGENYKGTLLNRPLEDAWLPESGNAVLKWGAKEETCIGVKIAYTKNDGSPAEGYLEDAAAEIVLNDYKPGTPFTYRTLFKPEPLSIDTFYAAPISMKMKREVITHQHLKNYRRPFAIGEWDGERWGTPADWDVSASAKTRSGGKYGGYDNLGGAATFGFEKWDNEPAIHNGKVWQTATLPAGTYEVVLNLGAGEWYLGTLGSDARYLAVAAGASLPDHDGMGTALAHREFSGQSRPSVRFTLDAPQQVAIGMVMNWTSAGAQYFRAQEVILQRIP